MKGQKETATEVDRENICTVSIWKGDGKSAQLIHVVNTAHNLAGRSSDVANSDLDDITAVECVDRHSNETITVPRQGLSRFKTDGDYDHFIFPHINNFLFDFLFSLAYVLIVDDIASNSTTKLFPRMASKLFNKKNKVDARASTYVNNLLDDVWLQMSHIVECEYPYSLTLLIIPLLTVIIVKAFKEVGQQISERFSISLNNGKDRKSHLKSHAFKRGAVQTLSEYLPLNVFTDRCGWMMEYVHSFFDYGQVSKGQDCDSGKTLQGWHQQGDRNGIIGGVPPTLDSVTTAKDKLQPFVMAMFGG